MTINKAIAALVLALIAKYTDFGGADTIAQVVEALVVGVGVWAVPNKAAS